MDMLSLKKKQGQFANVEAIQLQNKRQFYNL